MEQPKSPASHRRAFFLDSVHDACPRDAVARNIPSEGVAPARVRNIPSEGLAPARRDSPAASSPDKIIDSTKPNPLHPIRIGRHGMKKSNWITAGMIVLMVTAISWAQNNQKPAGEDEDIPKAALLTERGRQLAEELRMLRRNVANMGAKHPALEETKAEIEAVKMHLEAWAPAPNPFRAGERVSVRAIPQMNDEDLRQLVIRLTDDIRLLEQRLERVEKRTR